MHSMFNSCDSLKILNLSNFDTSNATSMGYMFYSCENLTTIYVGNKWNINNAITDTDQMFYKCGTDKVTKI